MAHTPRLGFAIGVALVTYLGGCDGRTTLMVPGAGPGSTTPGAPAGPRMGAPGNGQPGQPGRGNAPGRGGSGPGAASGACRSSPSQCTDGRDNDGDGKADADDPGVLGRLRRRRGQLRHRHPRRQPRRRAAPATRTASSTATPARATTAAASTCAAIPPAPGAAICPYTPDRPGLMCAEAVQACVNRCRQVTPNGCDCFGCCAIPGRDFAVRLSATCTAGALRRSRPAAPAAPRSPPA